MANSATTSTASHGTHGDDAHGAHPTEGQYWIVFVALAVLTAVEVGWSFIGLEGVALVLPLIVMMVVKFLLVGGAFMHLYFDTKIPKGGTFVALFAIGLILALMVFAATISAFEWHV